MRHLLLKLRRAFGALLALVALAVSASAQVPEIDDGGRTPPRTDKRLLIRRPLRITHNGGWQGLVFTPPFESAESLPAGGGYLAAHYQAARTDITQEGANVYRGTLHSIDFSGSIGITELAGPVEAKFDISLAQLAAANHEVSATYDGAQVVPGSWSGGASLRRAAFGLKVGIYDDRGLDLAVSTTGWAKLPIDGDDHLTDTGDIELGAVIALTHGLRVPADAGEPTLFLHAQIGAMWRQNQDVFNTRVRPQGSAVWAVGAVALLPDHPVAFVVQAEGSSNPFVDLDNFNSDPITLSVGTRVWGESESSTKPWWHGVMAELAVSFGLADRNGIDTALTFGMGYHF